MLFKNNNEEKKDNKTWNMVSYVISKILPEHENKSKTQSPSLENVSMR